MAKKLFVGNLSWDTTNDSLREFFAQIGPVISADVISDRNTGRSKGFGFVEFEVDADADKAKAELNGKTLDSREVAVHDARPPEERPARPSYDRGSGGGYQGGRDNRRGNDRRQRNRY